MNSEPAKTAGRPWGVVAIVLLVIVLLSGCSVGPDYQPPRVAIPSAYKERLSEMAPAGWKTAKPNDGADRGKWWTIYQDPLLNTLEGKVEIDNQSLKSYAAAYRQAVAVVGEARSNLFPSVYLPNGQQSNDPTGITRSRSDGKTVTGHTAALGASWDLDLWGKVRRQIESDQAAAQASAAQLAAMRLSAQAELATDYFELRYADSLEGLLVKTVSAYRRSLEITQRQYDAGAAAQSDVATAETQVQTTEAQRIAVGVGRAQYEHAIALLTGQAPADLSIPAAGLTAAIPDIPVTLPSALLERRPDIAQAERQMAQQNALIGVAKAAYFPDISLSGLFGYAGSGSLITPANQIWGLSATASQVLVDGGGRSATVEAARAAYDESAANYRQTVLTAFHDVEDALSALRILDQQAKAQAAAVASSRRAADIALREYQVGAVVYTTVVTAQATALSNQQADLQVKENQLTESIALLKALGGGWDVSALTKQ